MKIIKPMQQGVMSRTFVKNKRFYLSVASLSYFPFHNPEALGTEQEMWETISTSCGKDTVFDLCMPKAKGEVLMMGACHAPNRAPSTKLYVDLDFGPVMKRIVVTGNRHWQRGERSGNMFGRIVGHDWEISEPKPFFSIDIGWKNAFGGAGFEYNPLGKGYLPLGVDPEYDHSSPLPNVERPERMMAAPNSVAEPTGYGPLDISRPQRTRKRGTEYGKQWEKERFPEPAVDMDPTYYNAAPDDQQLKEGLWMGDERFTITNMHPDHPVQQSALPQIRLRCFALTRFFGQEDWRELSLRPETVWLFPNAERGILVSRGVVEVKTFYAIDVDTLLLAWELKEGASRTSEAYRNSVKLRDDEETAGDWMAREDDLSPLEGIPEEPDIFASPGGSDEGDAARAAKKMEEQANTVLSRAAEMLQKYGLNAADYLSKVAVAAAPVVAAPPLKKMSDVGKVMEWAKVEIAKAEQQVAEFGAKSQFGNITTQAEGRKVIEDRARAICEKAGQNFDEAKAAAAKNPPDDKPMTERMKDLIKKTKEEVGDNPEKQKELDAALKKIEEVEPQLKAAENDSDMEAAIRENAHYLEPPDLPSPERAAYLRDLVISQHQKGESCAIEDLSHVDLSNLDLRGANFKGAKLDSVKFIQTNLNGADLSETTLARADFSGSTLIGANLKKAGLGKTVFVRADMTQTDLTESAIHLTDFSAAVLKNAAIKVGMIREADFSVADLSGADLSAAEILKSTFEQSKFLGATLIKTSFMECRLMEADFSDANLEEASFVEVNGEKARFQSAKMKNANAHLSCKFAEGVFAEIKGEGINFAETNLVGADFSDADLEGAAFGESSLNYAKFDRALLRKADFTDADLSDARFDDADLMKSSLQGAILIRTRFVRAHLFAADLLHARIEDTDFRRAVVKRTLLEDEQ
jgi:uncharacterized protein YjbI with pentapeptide repeats